MSCEIISAFVLCVSCGYHLSPMSPSDRDIWTAASEVIKSNDDPLLHVALRYDALLKEGDMEGCRAWRRIGEAVEEMLKQQPDVTVH
jgi:hypothetical protein